MKVLVAHNVGRARTGGASRVMGFIHDEVVKGGHEVELFCADDVPRALRGRLGRFTFPALVLIKAVRAARDGRPYEIVNVHEPSSALMVATKRLAGAPRVVVTSHGLERRAWDRAREERRLGRDGSRWGARVSYPATVLSQAAFGLRHADHVFCLNHEDKDYICEHYLQPPSHVTRIYPAAAETFSRAAANRDYGRASALLFSGTWLKRKGVDDLVAAFTTVACRRPIELRVLGAGVSSAEVLGAFPPHLRPRVVCLNARTDEESAAVYAAADLFVLPSLFEGTPLTLMEAMASGLPVITTRTCGMRDVVVDRENGLLVPLRSPEAIVLALEGLLSDRNLREQLGRAARRDAQQNYTWPKVAEPVQRVYEQLCVAAPMEEQRDSRTGSAGEAYDRWHQQLDVDDAEGPWHDMVRQHLHIQRDLTGRHVLEIGCGRGGFSCWIAEHSSPSEQVAMDWSGVAIEKARAHAEQLGLSRVAWECGDIQAIGRADGSFDTVISCETIEHVPDPRRAVRELARVLRPGGRLFLTTPNYLNATGLYRGYMRLTGRRYTECGQPINQLTMWPRTLRWVREAGLRVLEIDGVGHYLPFPGRSPIRLGRLGILRRQTRLSALHSFVLAEKP